MHPDQVELMTKKQKETTIFDILVDNGMDEDTASDTVDSMSTVDMDRYLIDLDDEE